MRMSNKLVVIVSGLAIFAAPLLSAAAQARTRTKHNHYRHHYVRTPQARGYYESFLQTPNGELIDRQGWRYHNGSWDNTCLNVPWLPAQYACSAKGGF
jgi:hypothetical protein